MFRPPADDYVPSPATRALTPGDEELKHQVGHWHMLPNRLFEALSQTFRFNFMRLFFHHFYLFKEKKKRNLKENTLTFNNWLIKVLAGFNLLNKGNRLGMRSKEG